MLPPENAAARGFRRGQQGERCHPGFNRDDAHSVAQQPNLFIEFPEVR
jgi:hypothetical protein